MSFQCFLFKWYAGEKATDSIVADLKDVDVAYILNLVNFHSGDFAGKASGKAVVKSIFQTPEAYANLDVKDFVFENGPLGTLHAKAAYDNQEGQINIDATAEDGPEHLTVINGYVSPKRNYIDLGIEAHNTSLKFMENFCGSFLNNVEAWCKGKLNVVGDLKNINLVGDVVAHGEAVKNALLEAGLFGYINQLPYAVSTTPDTKPKAIFISALRDMPLASDFEKELEGNEDAFQAGLTALSKVAKVYLGVGINQHSRALEEAKNVEVNVFDGPCPAGNVGVQVNHIDPVNKGEVVWTVDPSAIIFFGRLFLTGKVDLRKKVAVAGSEIKTPGYAEVLVGTPLSAFVADQLKATEHVRLINGNPLTGVQTDMAGFVGGHTSEITAIPEGDDKDEMLGWILPRTSQFSTSRSYFSWLFGKKKEYDLDARVKGGERHMIMSGEYDKVLPMDIFGEYLIKAIITGDIDKQEQLGIYEVSPEDFAVAEFVDSSKLELQKIVRDGLNTLRKENA